MENYAIVCILYLFLVIFLSYNMAKLLQQDCFARALEAIEGPGGRLRQKHFHLNDRLATMRREIPQERQRQAIRTLLTRASFNPDPVRVIKISVLDCLLGRRGPKPRQILESIHDKSCGVIGLFRLVNHAQALVQSDNSKTFCTVAGKDLMGDRIREDWSLPDVLWFFGAIEVYTRRSK